MPHQPHNVESQDKIAAETQHVFPGFQSNATVSRTNDNKGCDNSGRINPTDLQIQKSLYQAGFRSNHDLQNASEAQLVKVAAGTNTSVSQLKQWIEQVAYTEQGERSQLQKPTDSPNVETAHESRETFNSDGQDLTRVLGIDTASAILLRQSGIDTYAKLYQADPSRLSEIFSQAGSQFQLIDTRSWSEQAKFAMNFDWTGLKSWQRKNLDQQETRQQDSTRTRPGSTRNTNSQSSDDLTKIHGIGPATQKFLKSKGIQSFEQIAKMDARQLSDIFASYETRFQLPNHENWPKQARLLANAASQGSTIESEVLNEIKSISEIGSSSPSNSEQRV